MQEVRTESEQRSTDPPVGGGAWDRAAKFLAVFATIVSLVTGAITLILDQRSKDLAHDFELRKMEVDAKIQQQQTDLDVKRFQLEESKRRDDLLAQQVPKILSASEAERQSAVAILFVIYPNDAKDILARISQTTTSPTPVVAVSPSPAAGQPDPPATTATPVVARQLAPVIQQATELDRQTGGWVVVVGTDTTLDAAKYEAMRATRETNLSPTIYHRGSYYRTTLGPYRNQVTAEQSAIFARAKLRADAYTESQNNICPNPTPGESAAPYKLYECSAD